MIVVLAGALLAAVGACLGSFVTTAALRAARGEGFAFGRSRCDACDAPLGFRQTIPVLAYAAKRGRCADCGAAIDPTHLIGETSAALVSLLAFAVTSPLRAGLITSLGLTLLALAVFDVKTMRLPDTLTAVVAGLGLGLSAQRSLPDAAVAVACALITLISLEALRRGYRAVRGVPGLGAGDVKLIAALALWLGLATPIAIGAAALGGLLIAQLRAVGAARTPFGPPLSVAAALTGLTLEALPHAAVPL